MELLIGAIVGGVLFALILIALIWQIVSRAVDNGLYWLTRTFGNERAAVEVEAERRTRG